MKKRKMLTMLLVMLVGSLCYADAFAVKGLDEKKTEKGIPEVMEADAAVNSISSQIPHEYINQAQDELEKDGIITTLDQELLAADMDTELAHGTSDTRVSAGEKYEVGIDLNKALTVCLVGAAIGAVAITVSSKKRLYVDHRDS